MAQLDRSPILSEAQVHQFVANVFGSLLLEKQVLSWAHAALGVIHAVSLIIHRIGAAMSAVRGVTAKHATKQVDRLLSNGRVSTWNLLAAWVPFVIGTRTAIVVTLDWTEFDGDGQATLALAMVTGHRRTTPLLWRTYRKSKMLGHRNNYEDALLERFVELLPEGVHVTLLADRGFGDQKLYGYLAEAGIHYVIRFRACIQVEDSKGEIRTAGQWLPESGRATRINNAKVTADRTAVPGVVVVHDKRMKEAWCLATDSDLKAAQVVTLYGKRFTCEETFRDEKDIRFGMGLSATSIGDCDRRDRLLLLSALAIALVTLLGGSGERCGLDRTLKVNTAKKRTHSLFRQGQHYYEALPRMRADRKHALLTAYDRVLAEQAETRELLATL